MGFFSSSRRNLVKACTSGDTMGLEKALAAGADPNSRHLLGFPAIMVATMNGHSDIVARLVEAGADPDLPNKEGETALMKAAEDGRGELVERLLAAGADPRRTDPAGLTSLVRAAAPKPIWSVNDAADDRPRVVRALAAAGADLDAGAKGAPPIFAAAVNNRADVIECLASLGVDIDKAEGPFEGISKISQVTPLLIAVSAGSLEAVRALLALGANPNARGSNSETPLISAAEGNFDELVRLLAKAGAELDATADMGGFSGITALMIAASKGNTAAAIALIESGADCDVTADNGWNARRFAKESGNESCGMVMDHYIARQKTSVPDPAA